MVTENGERALQWCFTCRQADDHPRHHHYDDSGQLVSRHIDCCVQEGCPDLSCHALLMTAGDKRGAELVAHVEALALQAQGVSNA